MPDVLPISPSIPTPALSILEAAAVNFRTTREYYQVAKRLVSFCTMQARATMASARPEVINAPGAAASSTRKLHLVSGALDVHLSSLPAAQLDTALEACHESMLSCRP